MKTPISREDLADGARIKLSSGTVFVIERIDIYEHADIVVSHLENGSHGNYRTEISDAIDFFNENNSEVIK